MKTPIDPTLLSAVMNTLVDAAVIIDRHSIIRSVNRACIDVFGYEEVELIGKNVSCLMPEPYHSAHDDYVANYHRTSEAKIIGIGREVKGKHKDGTVFPIDLAVGEMNMKDQPFYMGVIRDLSDRQARQTAFDELQARHFHLSRVAAMNEMGTAIAHEINQPLSAVSNYIETGRILLSRLDTAENESFKAKMETVLEKAVQQNRRAADIISRMRRFIERGDVRSQNFEIGDIIEDALLLGLSEYLQADIAVDITIHPKAHKAQGDPIQIQQVLVNLIRNAAEAMDESDVKELTILVGPDPESSSMICISVSDTGSGIATDILPNLFSAFASSKSSGMGVGLSISRSIISAHGGRIWASARDGGGTIFTFTLKVAK